MPTTPTLEVRVYFPVKDIVELEWCGAGEYLVVRSPYYANTLGHIAGYVTAAELAPILFPGEET